MNCSDALKKVCTIDNTGNKFVFKGWLTKYADSRFVSLFDLYCSKISMTTDIIQQLQARMISWLIDVFNELT
jgi:hypothetical protein